MTEWEMDENYKQKFEELEVILKEREIEYEEYEEPLTEKRIYKLLLKNGRKKCSLILYNENVINDLLDYPLEKYVFLGDYVSTASYEFETIEAIINSLDPIRTSSVINRIKKKNGIIGDNNILIKSEDDGQIELMLGECKDKLLLEMYNNAFIAINPYNKICSIKISNIDCNTHDSALDYLEQVTNSLFFQINMFTNFSLILSRRSEPKTAPGSRKIDDSHALKYPTQNYDKEPMSLYWYARQARGMPLLRYLAYYQSIEFYFCMCLAR